jgi:uncharacterized membrane protein YfcA
MIFLLQAINEHSALFFIMAAISVLLLGISKSGFGAGFGVLAPPLMASQSSLAEALAILLPILIAIDLVALRRFWSHADRRILKLILLPAGVGMLMGYLFFSLITPQMLYLPCYF